MSDCLGINDLKCYEKTIAKKWNIEPFYLDKTRWNIAIFYENDNSNFIHADTNRLVAKAASDIFNGVAITSVKTQVTPISGYGEAFKNARTNNFDYFVMKSAKNELYNFILSEVGKEVDMKKEYISLEIYLDGYSYQFTTNNVDEFIKKADKASGILQRQSISLRI